MIYDDEPEPRRINLKRVPPDLHDALSQAVAWAQTCGASLTIETALHEGIALVIAAIARRHGPVPRDMNLELRKGRPCVRPDDLHMQAWIRLCPEGWTVEHDDQGGHFRMQVVMRDYRGFWRMRSRSAAANPPSNRREEVVAEFWRFVDPDDPGSAELTHMVEAGSVVEALDAIAQRPERPERKSRER